jgi:hypothetical protein
MKSKMRKILLLFLSIFGLNVFAQDTPPEKSMEIYGFVMMDAGYNAGQIQSDWYDVVRPTKLSSFEDEYGPDGNFFFGVRQTRLGVKSSTPTKFGALKTQFEFELFGTGVDAGQTTLRLRHAYGELGKWGFGQTWSPFMDIDVFPNSIEYWGPCGMVFFRNVQARYMPIQGETRMTIALERPGASADQGPYGDWISQFSDISQNLTLPDLSAEYRHGASWGYVEIAGIVRQMKWKDMDNSGTDLSGDLLGYGINLSTNLKIGDNSVIRGSVVYGAGIQNYMNDATSDIGIESSDSIITPDDAKALPLTGIVAFLDHKWNERFSTSVGYSTTMMDNADVSDNTFKTGQYALVNLLYYPVENVMAGVELQWGARENEKADVSGYDGTDIMKVQFSFKYNFSSLIK